MLFLMMRIAAAVFLDSLMKVAIFSDIHSNVQALDAVLADAKAQGVTEYLCLGDIVGYAANPSECIERVRNLNCPVLLGNHDKDACHDEEFYGYNDFARAGMMHSRANLSAEQKSWLAATGVKHHGGTYEAVHASFHNPEEFAYVLSDGDAELCFESSNATCLFLGHTHFPMYWTYDWGDICRLNSAESVTLNLGPRYLFNIGSVGQPRDENPQASYVIYEPMSQKVGYRRVPYDVEGAMNAIRAAGLPDFLADRLYMGK